MYGRSKAKDRPSSALKEEVTKKRRLKTESFATGMIQGEYLETHIAREKIRIQRDVILKTLTTSTEALIELIDVLESFQERKVLTGSSLQKVAEHFFFLKSKFFRYENVDHQEAIKNLRGILNAIKFLQENIMRNKNILRDQGQIFVRQQYEFFQFFKYLLGKQSPELKLKYTRKVLQELWNFKLFYEKYPLRIFDTLNLWAHGISLPLNPARMRLHQAVIDEDIEFIKRSCQFKLKSPIYCHINQADSNGITPLMLAVYLNKQSVISTLLLEHADPYLVPLTKMPNSKKLFTKIVEQIQLLRGPLKIQRIPLSQPYTKNILQYCRDNNIQLLAKLLALDISRQFYSFKDNKLLIESLEKIPDCTFQITWKQQAKLFGDGCSDMIKVYKKRASIRFDFTVMGVFDRSIKKGSYSLVFKGKPDIQYYLVDYDSKKITNLIKELDIEQLEERVVRIIKENIVGRQSLVECVSEENTIKTLKGSHKQTILNLIFQKQNVKKDSLNKDQFKNYQQSLLNSKVIDYTKLTHSQIHYTLEEYIHPSLPQPSRKKTEEKARLEINTIPFFQLNMENLLTLSTLLKYFSPHFNKINQVLKWQKMLEEICCKGIYKEFPNKIVAEMKGIHLSLLFEAFNFSPNIKNDMFELLSTLEQQSFECILPRGTSFVKKQQQSLEESFLSSMTKFLKPEEEDSEFGEACLRYQKLLGDFDDDPTLEESRQNTEERRNSAFTKKRKEKQ